MAIRQSRVTDAEAFLAEVDVKVENNLSAPVEKTNAELDVNWARTDLLEAETALERAIDTLLSTLGVADFQRRPIFTAVDKIDLPDELPFTDDLVAVTTRHERINNAQWDLALLLEEVRLARDEITPDLRGRVSFGYDVTGDDPGSSTAAAARPYFSLELRLPLDNWRTERARYRQRILDRDDQILELADIQLDLEQSLRQQHRDYGLQTARVTLFAARADAEQAKLDATLRQYEVGAIDNLEVSRAKRTFDDAKVSLLNARVARAIIRQLCGAVASRKRTATTEYSRNERCLGDSFANFFINFFTNTASTRRDR